MKKRTLIGLAVIAAAVATMFAAPSVASATGRPSYILAVWKNPAGSPKFPQDLVTSYETNNVNVNILKDYATECGTFYQSDLYANDERTAKLIAGKVLRGGDESWPLDAKGNQIQRYATLTTDPCPVVVTPPPVVTPPVVTPEPTPPIVTPAPAPPVATPEVPSSPVTPVTPQTETEPTRPTTTPPPTLIPPAAGATPREASNVAPSQRIAPVPTPIRTEAKFTG